jgi:hypothetical protein
MITITSDKINTLNQNTYDYFIYSLDFKRITCSCEHSGCLIKHGHYTRSIKSDSDKLIRLSFLRVKCDFCGRTHAIVPYLIIPYSQITAPDQLRIIHNHVSGRSQESIMNEKCLIDENCIRRVITNFIKYYQQRLIAFSVKIDCDITDLVRECFEHFSCQFMQIKSVCNKYFHPPTQPDFTGDSTSV